MRRRSAALVPVVAAAACALGLPSCSALGLFDGAPAVSCLEDADCLVPGLVEDGCVHYVCDRTARLCVGNLADVDGDGQGAVGCAESPYASTGVATDCDDANVGAYAGAIELCGGADEDCDDAIDEDCVTPSVAVGNDHVCYLASPLLLCWGSNQQGQVGVGVPEPIGPHPRRVGGLEGVALVSVVAGDQTTCVTASDGRVFCWGANDAGQLALPPPTRRLAPTEVPDLEGADEIRLGSRFGCARFGTEVRCWGSNGTNALGIPGPDSQTPRMVPGLPPVTAIAASGTAACALDDAGSIWCWGVTAARDCGSFPDDGATCQLHVPGVFDTLVLGNGHGCAYASAPPGGATCFGVDDLGQLGGLPSVGGTWVEILGGQSLTSIAAGATHTCATTHDELLCWGNNNAHQLGLVDRIHIQDAAQILDGLDRLASVSANQDVTCLLRTTGEVLCWGSNVGGALGGTTVGSDSYAPVSPLRTWHAEGSP